MTNTIFRLGMPERLCTLDSIIKNEWVATTDVPKVLRSLDKMIEGHRNMRNKHVHRGQIPDVSKVLNDDLFSHLKLFSFVENVDSIGMNPHFIKTGYKMATTDLAKRMNTDISTVLTIVGHLFDTLKPHYDKTMLRIRT